MRARLPWLLALLVLGIGWGTTQPLGKIAVSTGRGHFALIFWQSVIGVVVLGAILLARRRPLVLSAPALRFAVVIALVGTVIPNSTFYIAVAHLPAGIMSVLIATVPLIAFPVAMALGTDRFGWRRLAGLGCGLAGVALIAAPGAALPDAQMVRWLPLAMVGPVFYALEGNIVARWGTAGLDPVQAMFAASLVAAALTLPLAIASGQWFVPRPPFGPPDWALVGMSALHALLYAGYVGLAARAGAVFASQTSYVVTFAGLGWAMLLLGERFPPAVWLALAVMLAGLFLVTPRPARAAAA